MEAEEACLSPLHTTEQMLRGLLLSRHCLGFSEAHEEIQDLVCDSGIGTITKENFT